MNKEDFPILNQKINGRQLIYLDNSATTQKPKQVIEAMNRYYEQYNANVHRGIHQLSLRATVAYEHAHEIVAQFIGAKFEEVIFTTGTTEGLNLLAYSLGKDLQPGDEIVLSEMEHHSNIVPWQRLAREKNLKLRYIPLTAEYRLDLNAAAEIITRKTKIVSVTQMSNVLGTINPVEELAGLAHARGALLLVDAAQAVPHLPINVKGLDCDFLVFSGHKLCGPTGIGVLYGKKELLEKMEPFLSGGDMIKEVTFEHSTWNDLPWKFEAGTPNIAGAIGLAAAVEYLQTIGMENIAQQGRELTRYALEKLSTVPNIQLLGPATAEDRGPIFSFIVEEMHPHDVGELLDSEGIAVRGGHHCAMPLHHKLGLVGSTRASFYFYNTREDIDALVEALQKLWKEEMEITIDRNEISSTALSEEQELYKENILDHYKNPRHKGELAIYSVKHREFNPLCGDDVMMYLHFNNGTISNASFTGQGCVLSQATASLLTEHIQSMPAKKVKSLTREEVLSLLGIPVSPTRIRCVLLPLKTVQRGIEQHETGN